MLVWQRTSWSQSSIVNLLSTASATWFSHLQCPHLSQTSSFGWMPTWFQTPHGSGKRFWMSCIWERPGIVQWSSLHWRFFHVCTCKTAQDRQSGNTSQAQNWFPHWSLRTFIQIETWSLTQLDLKWSVLDSKLCCTSYTCNSCVLSGSCASSDGPCGSLCSSQMIFQ